MPRVLVTDASGFIGHPLVSFLHSQGYFELMDLRSWPDCLRASKDVDEVYAMPVDTASADDQFGASAIVLGNESVINSQLIEAARQNGVRRYLYASSEHIHHIHQRRNEFCHHRQQRAYEQPSLLVVQRRQLDMLCPPPRHITRHLRRDFTLLAADFWRISRQKHQALYEQMRRDPAHKHETDGQVRHHAEYFLCWQSRHWPKLIERGVLLLVFLLFASYFAHCQVDLIQMQQGGTKVGSAVGAPTLNFANCLVVKSGQTWTITCAGTSSNATQIQSNNVNAGIPTAGQGYFRNAAKSDFELQNKPCSDWRDQGITTSGDQSPKITAVWNAANTAGCSLMLPLGTITLANSVTPSSSRTQGAAYAIEGTAGSGQAGSGLNFIWTGGASPIFNLDRQRDAIFGRFSLDMRGFAGGAGATGILLSQNTATSGQISSHNFFHDFDIHNVSGNGTIGFRIVGPNSTDSGQNNEAHVLWRPSIGNVGGFDPASSTCEMLTAGAANARSIATYEAEVIGCNTGYSLGGGTWHIIGGLTEFHGTVLNQTSGNGMMVATHDEASKQMVSAAGGSLLLIDNDYEMDNPDLAKYQWDFSGVANTVTTIHNNQHASAATITKMAQGNSGSGSFSWVSINDQWNNTTLANLPNFTNMNAIAIGTPTRYTYNTSGNKGGMVVFRITPNAPTGDGDAFNGFWLGAAGQFASTYYDSPAFTISSLYTVGNATHLVPFRYRIIMTDATGTSAATWKLLPPTDPVTGTTYAGPLNFDYQTNGNNFKVNRLETKPVTFSSLPVCSPSIEGMHAAVTDSTTNTWGVTITGSGSNHVGAYCDGTSWTVYAK